MPNHISIHQEKGEEYSWAKQKSVNSKVIIHCRHHLSSHWLKAYTQLILRNSATYRLCTYLLDQ